MFILSIFPVLHVLLFMCMCAYLLLCNIIKEQFHHKDPLWYPIIDTDTSLPFSTLPGNHSLVIYIMLSFKKCYINGVIQHMIF